MITVTIEKRKYRVINEWSELKLSKFIELGKVEIPDKLLRLYELAINQDIEKSKKLVLDITDEDLEIRFPEFYQKAILTLSDIPEPVLKRLDNELLYHLFNPYLKHFILSFVFNTPLNFKDGYIIEYVPKEIQFFELNNDTYYLPKPVMVNGCKVLMADEPIISFAEASDLDLGINSLKNGSRSLAMLSAIYCRRHEELYDEKLVLEREELFKDMTMDNIWSVFFCIGIPIKRFNINSGFYLKRHWERS